MHDPRTSTALRQLADLDHQPAPPRWSWAVARVDPAGRVQLPPTARAALGAPPGHVVHVTGVCRRAVLVLGVAGASLTVDVRGRLPLPEWLRRAQPDAVLVGTTATVVLLAPATVLDGLGDLLVEDRP